MAAVAGSIRKYREIMVAKYDEAKVAKWEVEGKRIKHNRDMDFDEIRKHYISETNLLLVVYGYNSYDEMIKGHI